MFIEQFANGRRTSSVGLDAASPGRRRGGSDAQERFEHEGTALPKGLTQSARLPQPILTKLIEASKKVVATDEFKSFATTNGYTVDPKVGDDMKKELMAYEKQFKEINDFLESTK